MYHDPSMFVPWLIHMCAVTHSYVSHDSFACVPWRIHMCAKTHWCVCHDFFSTRASGRTRACRIPGAVHGCGALQRPTRCGSHWCVHMTRLFVGVHHMTRLCVWRTLLVRVILVRKCDRIHTCDMTHSWLVHMCDTCMSLARYEGQDDAALTGVCTWLFYVCDLPRSCTSDSFVRATEIFCATWLIRDSTICVTCMSLARYKESRNTVLTGVRTWLAHACEKTRSCA